MGFWNWIKKGFLVIICIILLISFLVMNSLFVLSSSLEYENIQSAIKPILKEAIYGQVNKTETEKTFEMMKLYCQQNNTEFVISQEDYPLTIPCNEIISGNSDTIVDSQIDKFIQDNYYKKYEYSFLECFKKEKTPFFLVSEMSHKYFQNKFYFSLIISLILIGLIFFLVEIKQNTLIIAGVLLSLSSVPFSKLNMFASPIKDTNRLNILSLIFTQTYKVFLIGIILGIILIIAGISWRIWKSRQPTDKKTKKK